MTIKNITAGALKDFIHSPEYKKLSVVPITRHRALSHVTNPRVSKDDVVLLLAYTDQRLIGYLGILADKITLNGIEHKAGWMSCIWVEENSRGKGVSKALMKEAFRVWDQKVIATEFTPEARQAYLRSGLFSEIISYSGIRGYLRFNLSEILAAKGSFFRKMKPLLRIADAILNIFNNLRISLLKNQNVSHRSIEYVNEIDQETDLFIKQFQKDNLPKRQADELNWIIKNPWILVAPGKDVSSERYFFSSLEKHHSIMNVKIYDDQQQVKGFFMLVIRGKNLKIPYCFFNTQDTKEMATLILAHMREMRLNMITTFHPALKEYLLNHSTPFIYKKEFTREYLVSKIFQEDLVNNSSHLFQDGDGDVAFT
jgi:GNAT superfamily N-acetyltransferase